MPNLIDISTGKPFTRRSALKGLAAIIAAGVSPSVVSASTGGLRRGLGARLGMMGGGGEIEDGYVKDGCLLMLVGTKNEGNNKWTDLTGLNTFSCTGTTSFSEKSAIFSGSNKLTFKNSNIFTAINNHTCQIDVIAKVVNGRGDMGLLAIGGAGNRAWWLFSYASNYINYGQYHKGSYASTGTIVDASISKISCRGNKLYSKAGTQGFGAGGNATITDDISIGWMPYSYGYFKGEIYALRIYSRLLTDAENLQNSSIDSTLFGVNFTL